MLETLEGRGTLRRGGLPPAQWQVRYHFDIHTRVVTRPGLPSVNAESSSRGTITAINNDVIPEGIYWLTREDGEEIRVKNLGLNDWAILSPA